VPFDAIDGAGFRILPLLYRRLRELGVEGKNMGRLKGISRYQWAQYELQIRAASEVVALLENAGIPTILLKGLALNGSVYERGERTTDDMDIFVARDRVQDAIQALTPHGWKSWYPHVEELLVASYSCPLWRPGRKPLDLHWNLFHGVPPDAEMEREIWDNARPFEIGGAQTRILRAEFQLLHTSEHGLIFDETPPFRWLVDAWQVISRQKSPINWSRLASGARRRGLSIQVTRTLEYLSDALGLPLPDDALQPFKGYRPTAEEKLEYTASVRNFSTRHGFLQTLPRYVFFYRRYRKADAYRGFLEYLRIRNHLSENLGSHVWEIASMKAASVSFSIRRGLRPGRFFARLRGAWRIRTIYGLSGRRLRGFYDLERFGKFVMRWTTPTAHIALRLPHRDVRISIVLAHVRDWFGDLDSSMTVQFNNRPISARALAFDEWTVSFTARRSSMMDADHQTITLVSTAWDRANNDPRALGVPVLAVEWQRTREV